MTVKELISLLHNYPEDLTVAYRLYSEQVVFTPKDIVIKEECTPRPDGWIHNKRPDKSSQRYLMLPGK